MDAILAIIADGGRAIILIYREGVEILFFSFPFRVGSRGWGTLIHQNHAAGEENGSIIDIMVRGDVCVLVFS
jgi:hypothetical protein